MMGNRQIIKSGDERDTLHTWLWRGRRNRSPIKHKLARRARREIRATLRLNELKFGRAK